MLLTPGRSESSLAQAILFRNQCFYLENGANKNLALSGPKRVTCLRLPIVINHVRMCVYPLLPPQVSTSTSLGIILNVSL